MDFFNVIWTGTQFVAVDYGAAVLTSPDGENWTAHSTGATVSLRDIVWSGTTYVAVGYSSSIAGLGMILTSADGVSWASQIAPISLNAVTWSGSQFVAVGLDGAVQTSPDGVVWTARVSGTTANLQSVTWLEDHFIAVGSIGGESDGTILTSPDGVVWTEQAPVTTNGGIYDVACSDTRCVAVGSIGQVQTTP